LSYIWIIPGVHEYLVASGLGGVQRLIRIIEIMSPPYMNASPNQDIGYVSFRTDGDFINITSYNRNTRRLVIIGDSITAACALVAFPPAPCSDTTGWQSDYTLSYGHLLCNNFSANCTSIAVSGKGLIANCCDQGPTMPDYFLQTEYGNPQNGWNFLAEGAPQGVVINLGTNDFYKHNGTDFEKKFYTRLCYFYDKYYNLLSK